MFLFNRSKTNLEDSSRISNNEDYVSLRDFVENDGETVVPGGDGDSIIEISDQTHFSDSSNLESSISDMSIVREKLSLANMLSGSDRSRRSVAPSVTNRLDNSAGTQFSERYFLLERDRLSNSHSTVGYGSMESLERSNFSISSNGGPPLGGPPLGGPPLDGPSIGGPLLSSGSHGPKEMCPMSDINQTGSQNKIESRGRFDDLFSLRNIPPPICKTLDSPQIERVARLRKPDKKIPLRPEFVSMDLGEDSPTNPRKYESIFEDYASYPPNSRGGLISADCCTNMEPYINCCGIFKEFFVVLSHNTSIFWKRRYKYWSQRIHRFRLW